MRYGLLTGPRPWVALTPCLTLKTSPRPSAALILPFWTRRASLRRPVSPSLLAAFLLALPPFSKARFTVLLRRCNFFSHLF